MSLSQFTPNYHQLADGVIMISFQQVWDQDDIARLKSIIMDKTELQQVEHILGADRENFRLRWQQRIFCLNFDCYTQSCWIETELEQDSELLADLLLQLNG